MESLLQGTFLLEIHSRGVVPMVVARTMTILRSLSVVAELHILKTLVDSDIKMIKKHNP
ncbi:MAG: hypothetical protein O8C66_09635 [Candidatus Methanoperedens sp.]|nr:hypothetical protein [Candidatus Methanoperedens sp.]MCZ7370757.1 hypothetical protein [Candidatus Methanoperedens sp.]